MAVFFSHRCKTLSLPRNFIKHKRTLTIGKQFGAMLLQIAALKVDKFITHDININKRRKLTIQFEIKRVFSSRPEAYLPVNRVKKNENHLLLAITLFYNNFHSHFWKKYMKREKMIAK